MTTGLRSIRHCLVTGASGFIGRALCERLRAQGVRVRVLLRQPTGGPWDEVHQGDLLDPTTVGEDLFSGIDTVFYLAAIAHRHATQQEYLHLNTEACLKFARRAAENGINRFIYFSSTKACREDASRMLTEEENHWPLDPYGLSKRQAEEGLLAMNVFSHLVILRPCLVYGAGVKGNLYSLLKAISQGWFPALPEIPARRSMVSVRGVADAAWLAANTPSAHRQIYFLADEQAYSVNEMENAIRHAFGRPVRVARIPTAVWRIAAATGWKPIRKLMDGALYSSEKIRRELGWQSHETFYDVLPEMSAVFLAQATPMGGHEK